MVNQKIMFLGMAFGAAIGAWIGFSITQELLSPWNFVLAFLGGVVGFLAVYFFYRKFY